MKIAHIALDVPLHQHFDYLAEGIQSSDVGRRAFVPWGRKLVSGVIVGIANKPSSTEFKLKAVREIMRDIPPLPPEILDLAKFCSEYYHYPLGQVLAALLPQRLRRTQGLNPTTGLAYRLTACGAEIIPESLPSRALRKRRLLSLLQASGPLSRADLLRHLPGAGALLREFEALNWLEKIALASPPKKLHHDSNSVALDAAGLTNAAVPRLNPDQSQALQTIITHTGFHTWLLYGVTGSGKTEVYLQAIATVLARQGQVLVLVPEINLTPQLEARFRARFPNANMCSLHSNLNEGERLKNWLAASSGVAHIVLGTRLAVFAPMPKLAMIVVDEEHDSSYKQQEGMHYSARDVAVIRGKRVDIPVILGSATPSLESYHNALQNRYGLLVLRERAVADATMPHMACIDLRRVTLTEGLSAPLITALKQRLARGEQSLLFINRRGYAPVLYCGACAWVSSCQRCSSHLVVHLKQNRLRCHYCGHAAALPRHCPSCGSAELAPVGHGTQRIEATLKKFFPEARILRIDRDSTRAKHALAGMLQQVQAREVDILVGTQMLAKGHDFPHLTLVGVVNADGGLYSADFRASERLFTQLLQVAGRAGRAALKGEVLIQTAFPEHALFAALRLGDYAGFANALLQERRSAGLPPFSFQALLRAEANQQERALKFLQHAASVAPKMKQIKLYDAVPALMSKLAGKERAQLLVEASSRADLQKFLRVWIPALIGQKSHTVRWSLDVDPLEN